MEPGRTHPTSAAFFDLDKTVLATASSMALRDPLVRAGLITRRGAAIGILIHLPYLLRGADEHLMERMRESLGDLARGWDAAVLESTVKDALTGSIDPVCFTEALDLIALHRAAGHAVVIASASVEQMVRPIASMLGADHAIGSVAEVDETTRSPGGSSTSTTVRRRPAPAGTWRGNRGGTSRSASPTPTPSPTSPCSTSWGIRSRSIPTAGCVRRPRRRTGRSSPSRTRCVCAPRLRGWSSAWPWPL